MKLCVPLILLTGLMLGAEPTQEKAKKDLEKLKGTWSITRCEAAGAALPEEVVKGGSFAITGDKYEFKMADQSEDGIIKLDPSKDPHEIELDIKSGNDKDKIQVGIYKLEGDTLMMCFAQAGEKQRPKEFTTKAGTNEILFVVKKEKK
jgi:uncharacterized protein (TIGR03067 family)